VLLPLLRVLAVGELLPSQVTQLTTELKLSRSPRLEGPGAEKSLAHHSWEANGTRLVADLAQAGEQGWALALFFEGDRPPLAVVKEWRVQFRDTIERLGLELVEVTPAELSDEVFVPADAIPMDPGLAAHPEALGTSLEKLWPNLGVSGETPRSVKIAHLKALIASDVWGSASPQLQHEALAFLRGDS
jgi:hypothetical protein